MLYACPLAIAPNDISGCEGLPAGLVSDMTVIYRLDIWLSNQYTPTYPALIVCYRLLGHYYTLIKTENISNDQKIYC